MSTTENADNKYSNIGQELKKAREKKHLSLEELSKKLKIKVEYLKNLEADNFTFLHVPYVLAFLKTYSQVLGLDPDEFTEMFYEVTKTKMPTTHEIRQEDPLNSFNGAPESGLMNNQLQKGIVLTVVIVVFIALLLFLKSFFSTTGNDDLNLPQRYPTETTS